MLVDDHRAIRRGVRRLIVSHTDMEVVGEAENGRVAVELAAVLNPDVIVMDVSMPVMNGVEAARLIKAQDPDVKVIALSAHNDPVCIAGMMDAGASRYVCKDNLFDELVQAIRDMVDDAALDTTLTGN